MTTLLQRTVTEPQLQKLLDLARSGEKPSVEWSPSKADMDAQAFVRRGEILADIAAQVAAIIGE